MVWIVLKKRRKKEKKETKEERKKNVDIYERGASMLACYKQEIKETFGSPRDRRVPYLLPLVVKILRAFVTVHDLLQLSMFGLQCRAQRGDFPTHIFYLVPHTYTEALTKKEFKIKDKVRDSRQSDNRAFRLVAPETKEVRSKTADRTDRCSDTFARIQFSRRYEKKRRTANSTMACVHRHNRSNVTFAHAFKKVLSGD